MSLLDGLSKGLLPASFRGVPFAVLQNDTGGGRRQVVHQYPGRDDPWAEDMGREARTFRFRGFLINNDRIYAGGPVAVQRALLYAALDTAGPGLLTHPTLGLLQVSVRRFSLSEDLAAGTYSDVEIEFVEAGKKLFPTLLASSSGVISAATLAKVAIVADVARAIVLATGGGAPRSDLAKTHEQWAGETVRLSRDATALSRLTAHMQGNYGRYQAGGNTGLSGTTFSSYADASIADLAAAAATQRATVSAAAGNADRALAGLTVGTVEADVVVAIAALVDALAAACADPADALRLLLLLFAFQPLGPEAASPAGSAISDAYRRAAIIALGRVSTTYQPSSYDDAVGKIGLLSAAVDQATLTAGDEGADATFQALRNLRSSMVDDLRERGGTLAPVRPFSFGRALPALVLAQRLYRDPDRADELIGEVPTAPSPLFMPPTILALAA